MQTSTAKLPEFFLKCSTEVSTLRVNETKITAVNAFNPDDLWMEGKHESKKRE